MFQDLAKRLLHEITHGNAEVVTKKEIIFEWDLFSRVVKSFQKRIYAYLFSFVRRLKIEFVDPVPVRLRGQAAPGVV
ncbi:hypothetical protein PM8797T_08109 [Gimesia maris DSM 8797]|nr:hypothetical protein PM8797T_08109 [Gimesia maris DSM 8797]